MRIKQAFGVVVGGTILCSVFQTSAYAEPPPKGSFQWDLLSPYVEFIRRMKKPNGAMGCCDMSDGRGELDERQTPDGHYQVKITRAAYNDVTIPEEGVWIDIDPDSVLGSEDVDRYCDPIRKAQKQHTCWRPPFNVLWLNISQKTAYCYIPRALGQ